MYFERVKRKLLVIMPFPYSCSKPTGILRGHTAPIFHLFISADDDRIFSISTDKTVKVRPLPNTTCATCVCAHRVCRHTSWSWLTRPLTHLYGPSCFASLQVWDLHDHTCLLTVRPKAHRIRGDLSGDLIREMNVVLK